MNKSLVTETAGMLCYKAEKDIMTVDALYTKPKYPEDQMYDIICFHATQAVEKLLKSFIISNGKTVEKIHDLDILQKSAMEIDNSFSVVKSACVLLNTFVPNIKYDDEDPITKQDMDKIIKSLENVCNFPPIKAMRDSFSKEHNYKIVDEITTDQNNK
ncbi:MAG: HEPN domain-containing protein [Treponema sp.]|jgi:HEPN domain-containing protein|nr:HEPN domain-containing protein [Treponema sp.]